MIVSQCINNPFIIMRRSFSESKKIIEQDSKASYSVRDLSKALDRPYTWAWKLVNSGRIESEVDVFKETVKNKFLIVHKQVLLDWLDAEIKASEKVE